MTDQKWQIGGINFHFYCIVDKVYIRCDHLCSDNSDYCLVIAMTKYAYNKFSVITAVNQRPIFISNDYHFRFCMTLSFRLHDSGIRPCVTLLLLAIVISVHLHIIVHIPLFS